MGSTIPINKKQLDRAAMSKQSNEITSSTESLMKIRDELVMMHIPFYYKNRLLHLVNQRLYS